MKDHPAVLRYASSFARTTGIEYDDLLQEARMAHARAVRAVEDGTYDPRAAGLDTFATRCVYNQMVCVARRRRSPETTTLDEEAADDQSTSPERRLLLMEMIRELPDDARAVVDLLLGDGLGDAVDQVLAGGRGVERARKRLMRQVRERLGLRRGDRAQAAFSAVSDMLAEIVS